MDGPTTIRIRFNKDMNAATINNTNITMAGTNFVSSVNYDSLNREAVVSIVGLIDGSEVITITSGVQDTQGNSITQIIYETDTHGNWTVQ